jgi:hypothetical protein
MVASTGNSRSRATTDQFERITTTVDPHSNLPNHLLPRRRRSFAGALAPAAATAPLRRPHPPVVPLPQPSAVIEPPGTRGPSPARARLDTAAGSPDFGGTAAGRRPRTPLQAPKSFQGPNHELGAYL